MTDPVENVDFWLKRNCRLKNATHFFLLFLVRSIFVYCTCILQKMHKLTIEFSGGLALKYLICKIFNVNVKLVTGISLNSMSKIFLSKMDVCLKNIFGYYKKVINERFGCPSSTYTF